MYRSGIGVGRVDRSGGVWIGVGRVDRSGGGWIGVGEGG